MKKNKRYGSQYLVAAGISLLLLTAVFQLSARLPLAHCDDTEDSQVFIT